MTFIDYHDGSAIIDFLLFVFSKKSLLIVVQLLNEKKFIQNFYGGSFAFIKGLISLAWDSGTNYPGNFVSAEECNFDCLFWNFEVHFFVAKFNITSVYQKLWTLFAVFNVEIANQNQNSKAQKLLTPKI